MSIRIITGYVGEAHVTSDDAASLNRSIFGVGKDKILGGIGRECAATLNTDGNTVTIDVGDVIIDGVHARIESPVTVVIENGTQGLYRNDLIVARYYKNPSSIESVEIKVIKGTAGSTGIDPSYNKGLIGQNDAGTVGAGSNTRDMVLYRVVRYGATIQSVEKVAETHYFVDTHDGLYIQGNNNGYAHVRTYTSSSGSNTIQIEALSENKESAVALSVYDNGTIGYFKGSTFFSMPFVQGGTATIPKGETRANITFPRAYKTAPIVVATIATASVNQGIFVNSVTTTGCEIVIIDADKSYKFNWIATGTQLA